MTNFEKYKKQMEEFIYNTKDSNIAVADGKIIKCEDVPCSECELSKKSYIGFDCFSRMLLWLCEEYQEPSVDWSKVAVDTKVLVSDDGGKWFKRYFASYEDGRVYVWYGGGTSWSNNLTSPYNYAKLAEGDAE